MIQTNKVLHCFALAGASLAALTQLSAQDAPPPSGWQSSVGITLNLSGGNSDTFNFGANAATEKKWDKNEFFIGADAQYGTSTTQTVVAGQLFETDQTNVNNYGGFAQYNRLLSERWYLGFRATGRHDEIAGVDYNITTTANVGYRLIKQKNLTLSLESGPGYVWEKLDGVGSNNYATIRFADNFEWKFAEKTRLFQTFEYLPQIDDWGNYVFNATVGIETDIYKGLALQIVFRDFYRSQPAQWAGTYNPVVYRDKNDYQLMAGVVYKF